MAKVQQISKNDLEGPLAGLAAPPPLLRACGNTGLLQSSKAVGIVGSRQANPEELQLAFDLAQGLAEHNITVVSGLALGIDGASHRGALAAGGPTVAFLGAGLAAISPKSHLPLAKEIYHSGGLLVSEVENNETAKPQYLVARNRLISGLAQTVIVICSGIDGGTMHTVRFAVLQERLLCVPDAEGIGGEGVRLLLSNSGPEAAAASKALKPLMKKDLGSQPLVQGFNPKASDSGLSEILKTLQ